MVFGLLCDIIRKNEIDLARVLEAGFSELRLNYVTAIQAYDSSRHVVLNWELKSNFWHLIERIDHTKTIQSSQLLTGQLKENRSKTIDLGEQVKTSTLTISVDINLPPKTRTFEINRRRSYSRIGVYIMYRLHFTRMVR